MHLGHGTRDVDIHFQDEFSLFIQTSVKTATDIHRSAHPWWSLRWFTVKNRHQSSKWKVVWCAAHRLNKRKSEISFLLLLPCFSIRNIDKNIIS